MNSVYRGVVVVAIVVLVILIVILVFSAAVVEWRCVTCNMTKDIVHLQSARAVR